MSLLGITTFMFALGFIILVLNTTMGFQESNLDNSILCTTCYYVWETAAYLMVRLRDAFL